uniref:RNA-directed RNA polymerase L n=1 Tax=Phasivirus phasiense TaxID=3052631 RepID=A0A1B3B563_9VIRU|nr:RNA-dependent RNA polymerase [Phasivirus phasiense]
MSTLLNDIVIDSLSGIQGDVVTGDEVLYHDSVAGIPIPEVLVDVRGDLIGVSFRPLDDDDVVSTVGSSVYGQSLSYNLGDWKLNNLVHDFTFGELIENTDRKLSEIFQRSGAEITRFTPDHVSEEPDFNIIVEGGTNQGSLRSVKNYYEEKKQKYDALLRTIHQSELANEGNAKKILFGIIIVGHEAVATNLALSKEQVIELQMRFRVGLRIQKELTELGLVAKLPEDATEIDKRLEQYFLKLDLLSDKEIENWNKSIKRQININNPDKDFLELHLKRWDEDRIKELINHPDKEAASIKTAKILHESLSFVAEQTTKYEFDEEARRVKSQSAHADFEKEYISRNEGNMFTAEKAFINFPMIVIKPSEPSRVPSRGLKLSEAKFETVYDTLYYAGILKAVADPLYFPDHEADILEQYKWETPLLTSKEELQQFKDENLPKLFQIGGTFSLNNISSSFLDAALSLVTSDVNKQSELAKDFKGKTSRFNAYLTDANRFDLALKGVQGKGLTSKFIKGKINVSYNASIDEARESKPDWFHITDTNTDDMDLLMNDTELFMELTSTLHETTTSTTLWQSLINQARDYHGDNYLRLKEEQHQAWLSKSLVFNWCKLITDIGTEVDISMKQNCKKDEFIFKKLQDFNVWLLIKSTKKEDKIFFSVLFRREDIDYLYESTVFKRLNKLFGGENYLYTNFISLTESKLLNWVLVLPRMIGLFRFWSNFSNIEPYSEQNIRDLPETHPHFIGFYKNAMPMLILSIIIGLNDKTEVEEEITRTRYMVMESLTEWPIEPRPYKMASKASMAMRSRLTLWLYRKHKDLCHRYTATPPRARNEDVTGQEQTETSNQLFWEGFVNPYTNFKLTTGQQVINLFYLGYIKNKDETAQANKASKLYDKILTYELQYDLETAKILGLTSPQKPRPHCFDLDLLIDCGRNLNHRINESYPEFNYNFMKELHNFMFLRSVEEEFSTLKASSNFNEELYDRKKVSSKYQRGKVIEKLALEGEGATSIAELFEKKYLNALKSRGLNIDIFRKPQHGGDREIYVLGFQERVVQRLIEQISRIICRFIPEETMTHPGNKTAIPENSSREARTKYKMGHLTFNSSADASKWSQNNSSFKMMICLLTICPPYLHKTIIRCLRLWEFKRILINPQILELFDKYRNLKLYDKTLQCMFDGYKGLKTFRWIRAGSPYIEVTTGMMQGILHYTSSLYHSAIISRVKEVVQQSSHAIQEILKYPKPFKLIMCHLQSSDDSYFSVSAPLTGDASIATKSRVLATAILQFKVNYSSHCGVVNSIKTVLNSNHVFEFNSNFEFGFNHYKPDIKAIFSGFLVSEQELLLTRQEELSVLLTSYLENGGTNYVANGLQLGQSYLHYHLMGLTTTKYFRTYEVLQTILPDPSIGFFVMDNPMCPGLLGFKYGLWNLVKSSNLGKLYKHKLRPITLTDAKLEENVKLSIELSAHGSLSASYKLIHGNRRKWLSLLERMNVDQEWREKIQMNPEILFRRALNPEEVRVKISQKMHSPGVSASLSKLNTIPRILAESAYVLKLQAVTSLSNWIDPRRTEFSKVTLIEAILKEMKEVLADDDINEQEMRILFPFHEDFTRNQQLLSGVHVVQIGQSFREYKRKVTSVEIATNNEYSLLSLRGILLSFWFENNTDIMTPRLSKEHRDYIFTQHQKVIPWIRKDINESLANSPFNEMVEMLLWLNTFSGRRRIVRLLGTQIISKHGHSRLLSVVINNLSSSHRLNLDRVELESPVDLISTVRSKFTLASSLPGDHIDIIKRIFSSAGNQVTFAEGAVRSKQNDVVLMCKLARVIDKGWKESNSDEVLSIINDMKRNKHGTLGLFTTRQRVSLAEDGSPRYHGLGVWEGIIDGYDIMIRIRNTINKPVTVQNVTVNTPLASVESIAVRKFIENMGWVIPSDIHSGRSTLFLNDKGLNSNSGVPIIVDEGFNVNIAEFYKLQLTLEWTGRNLRCVAKLRKETGRGVNITVLSLSPKIQHYEYMAKYEKIMGKGTLGNHWLENKPLSHSAAVRIIRSFNEHSSDEKNLIRANLKAKLQSQGISFRRKIDLIDLAFISKEEQDELLDDYMLFQMPLDLGDLNIVDFEEVGASPEIVEFEDFELRNVEELADDIALEFEERTSPIEVIKREIWRLHPLFKDFSSLIISQIGRDAINKLITRREYNREIESYLPVFEIILEEDRSSWTLITPISMCELAGGDNSEDSE